MLTCEHLAPDKGIGRAIAEVLAITPGLHCIATARDDERGRAAVA